MRCNLWQIVVKTFVIDLDLCQGKIFQILFSIFFTILTPKLPPFQGVPCAEAGVNLSTYNSYDAIGSIDDYEFYYDEDDSFAIDDSIDYNILQRRVAGYDPEDVSDEEMDRELAAIFGVGLEEVKAMESQSNQVDDGEHSIFDLSEAKLPGPFSRQTGQQKIPGAVQQSFKTTTQQTKIVPRTTQQATTTAEATTTAAPVTETTTHFVAPVARIRCKNLKDDLTCEALKIFLGAWFGYKLFSFSGLNFAHPKPYTPIPYPTATSKIPKTSQSPPGLE